MEISYSDTDNVWIALGGDTAPAMTPNNDAHTLNQLWWLTTNGASKNTNSLETGWINSSYFTQTMQTTIFAYSTTDGYNNGPSDHYNSAGDFVQYSSSPIIPGVPLTNISYVFAYSKAADGYELDLYPINADGSLGTQIAVGYYPYSRYTNGANENFDHFGGGAEIYVAPGKLATLSGTMYGVGTNYAGSLANSWALIMRASCPDYSCTTQTVFGQPAVVFSGSNM